jgi:hypothetical protein
LRRRMHRALVAVDASLSASTVLMACPDAPGWSA